MLCVLLFLLLGFRLFVVSNTFVHVTVLFNVVIVVFLAFLVCFLCFRRSVLCVFKMCWLLNGVFVVFLACLVCLRFCVCLYMRVRFLVKS